MGSLIRLVYISRSTVPTQGAGSTIDPGVARILAKSRSNNKKRGLVGVLYFANDYFLQCLEGPVEAVDELMTILGADTRHTDIKVLVRQPIAECRFSNWNMKFVPADRQMQTLLARHGYRKFTPHDFTPAVLREVIELLATATDITEPKSYTLDARAEGNGRATASGPARSSSAKPHRVGLWAGGTALVALILVALYTVLR